MSQGHIAFRDRRRSDWTQSPDELGALLVHLRAVLVKSDPSDEVVRLFVRNVLTLIASWNRGDETAMQAGWASRQDSFPAREPSRIVLVVARIEACIAERCTNPRLSVADVASALRISRWQVGRLLMRATGRSFRWHLARARVRVALDLLNNPDLSIKEIAARAGFATSSEFSRQCQRVLGMCPTAYREHAHETATIFARMMGPQPQ